MIDLDAKRAERREAQGEAPVVRVNGKEYQLAVEMPYGVLEALAAMADPATAAGAAAWIAKALLGEHYDAITEGGFSADDLNALIEGVMEEYGVNAPLPSPAS